VRFEGVSGVFGGVFVELDMVWLMVGGLVGF
jgi:hypothetical protein